MDPMWTSRYETCTGRLTVDGVHSVVVQLRFLIAILFTFH